MIINAKTRAMKNKIARKAKRIELRPKIIGQATKIISVNTANNNKKNNPTKKFFNSSIL